MMKLGTVIPYPKKIEKLYESRDTSLEFCCYQFLILLIFLESLRVALINMVTILMMSAILPIPGLLKIKVF